MCPYEYYKIMKNSKDKKQIRYQMIVCAEKEGIKPASRIYKTTVKTIKKWKKRFKEKGYVGLEDKSKRPHNSPKGTSEKTKEKLVELKKKYKRLGAKQIREIEKLNTSERTMRKIWREKGVSSRARRKKHVTKNNLRKVKKEWELFQQVCEDTKDLIDIPEYWKSMVRNNLPKVQYTFREVTTGLMYLGFAETKSLVYSTLFAEYINYHLTKLGVDLSKTTRQTDNGSEYIGSWQAKEPSDYTLAVEAIKGQKHVTIPPGAHRYQADVETVHDICEREFYELENFNNNYDFLNKCFSYQLFFNLERPNTYKENKTPYALAKEKMPDIKKEVFLIPPVDLRLLLKKKIAFLNSGGYHVSSSP